MLLRIALIIALVVSAGALGVSFQVKNKIVVIEGQRDQFEDDWEEARSARQIAENLAREANEQLDETNALLSDTSDRLERTEVRLGEQTDRADRLNLDFNRTSENLTIAQQEIQRWRGLNRSIEQLRTVIDEHDVLVEERDGLIAENGTLNRSIVALEDRISLLTIPNFEIQLPNDIAGTVQAVDPKFNFVILNIGSDDMLKPQSKLAVSRDGRLVGKLQVTSLEGNRSIANILPGWNFSDIREGDSVIPSYESISGEL